MSFQFPLLLCAVWSLGNAEVFSAIADLQNMLGAERHIAPVIEDYIEAESKRLENLRSLSQQYFSGNTAAEESGPEFMTNPVNAFSMIKRVRLQWQKVEEIMRNNTADQILKNISDQRVQNEVKFPEQDDLSGAASALMRLQDVYKLDTHELASGIIGGEKVGTQLTANDCSHVGSVAYNAKDFYHALLWLQEALDRVVKENPPTVKETYIREYLAYALYAQGNGRRALEMAVKWTTMAPNDTRAQGQLRWYVDQLPDVDVYSELPPMVYDRSHLYSYNAYEALCRGEQAPPAPDEQRKLYCYLKNDRPFLKLAPIKVEIMRHDPLAVVFRGVISDGEIEVIKKLATPKLIRSTVLRKGTSANNTSPHRISKNTFLGDHVHEVLGRLTKRVADMTNLNQQTSENYQVTNYGLGGHYAPHWDFAHAKSDAPFTGGTGNRVATVLFYMSQPEKGGSTVFDKVGTAVPATMHDALFWYNLKRNGQGDERTQHAACPVLLGVKWVANKWIREHGQEFLRPCGLDEEAFEHFIGDLHPTYRPI